MKKRTTTKTNSTPLNQINKVEGFIQGIKKVLEMEVDWDKKYRYLEV